MAGFTDIDVAAPAGTDAVSVSAEFRSLKDDILDGVVVEHDDGHTSTVAQGEHKFSITGSTPVSASHPNGHMVFRTGLADGPTVMVNDAAAVAYKKCGVGLLTKIAASAVVNNATESVIAIQAWAAAHREYLVSAYTNAGTTPTIVFSNITGADICVWVERVKGGNDELHIRNDTANPETVFYSVRQLISE